MRTSIIRIALSIALVLSIGLVNAAGPVEAGNGNDSGISPAMERAVIHQINRTIPFPLTGDEDHMYGIVEVAFAVNTEGDLVILSAESENQELCDYVVRKLTRIHIAPNPSGLWRTSHVRFTFHPEA